MEEIRVSRFESRTTRCASCPAAAVYIVGTDERPRINSTCARHVNANVRKTRAFLAKALDKRN